MPSQKELQDPELFANMAFKRKKLIQSDLSKTKFEVRIVDFGLSKFLPNKSLADTPCGTFEVIAPEALAPGSDHRVDIWGLG